MSGDVWLLRGGSKKGPYERRKIIAAFAAGRLHASDRLLWPGRDTPLAPLEAVARLMADTGTQLPPRRNYAGFARRAVAFSIDNVLLMAMIGLPLFRWFSTEMKVARDLSLADLAAMAITLTIDEWATLLLLFSLWAFLSHLLAILGLVSACVFAYHAASELIVRGTPGKLLVGIRVTTPEGDSIGIRRAIARAILRVFLTLCMVPLYATHLLQLSGPRRQTLLDLITDTVVVRR